MCLRAIIVGLLAFTLLCNGCVSIDSKSLSTSWKHRDFAVLNETLRIRCAEATSQDEEDFRWIQAILLEADSFEVEEIVALEVLARIAFAYCYPESEVHDLRQRRIRKYEDVISALLRNTEDPRCSACLLWLYTNQHHATKSIVDAVFGVAFEAKDPVVRGRAVTFISAFFGFVHAGFFFTDDVLPGGIEAFPLERVYRYWRSYDVRVMGHRMNLLQYAKMGYYNDNDVNIDHPPLVPSFSPPSDMGLAPAEYPFTEEGQTITPTRLQSKRGVSSNM